MKKKFLSRKFILAVVTALLVILNDGLGWGIDEDAVLNVVKVVLGYIFAEGSLDLAGIIKSIFNKKEK